MAQETDSEKIGRWERENEGLRAEIERLRRALEEALRTAKRQAQGGERSRTAPAIPALESALGSHPCVALFQSEGQERAFISRGHLNIS